MQSKSIPSGRHDHLHQIYSHHHNWLYGWLCSRLGCTYQAADVAQNTFLRLFSLSSLAAITEPRGFLTTTATRLIIDESRRKKVEQRYLESYSYYHGAEAVAPSAEDMAIITETITAIIQMLEGLSEKCQRAFLMCRLDGMRQADIATELGVSKSMVQQYIAKSMLYCYQLTYDINANDQPDCKPGKK